MTTNQQGDAPHPSHGSNEDGAVALTAHVTAGPGGVMTDEVGVITGDVTLTTEPAPGGTVQVRIQYTGAEEWYTVTGSPTPHPADGLAVFHERVVDAVKAGGAAEVPGTIS